MKIFFSIVAFFFLCIANAAAQEITIGGRPGNRPLVWNDFSGMPDDSSPYFAKTDWNISYGYSDVKINGNNVVIKNLAVNLQFVNDRSWKKKDKTSDALLQHEQGHFDIAVLCQLDILATIKATHLRKDDIKMQIKDIFREAIQKYTALEDKYDAETEHSMNKQKQQDWNALILAEKERYLNQH